MNAEVKAKWIAALRSGQYRQTQGQLRKGDRYCCLGVLCLVADHKISGDGMSIHDQESGEILGYQAFSREGVSSRNCSTLVNMNDNGQSFAQIADYIEREL